MLPIKRNKSRKIATAEIEFGTDAEYPLLFDSIEKTLRTIEETFGITASSRGNKIFLRGREETVRGAEKLLRELHSMNTTGITLSQDNIREVAKSLSEGREASLGDSYPDMIPVPSKQRFVVPKTETQKQYLRSIRDFDVVIGIGPAGTGKTYLAMAMAIHALTRKQVSRIVLARPAIEAGEKLGFLPGDMFEKVNPYLRPLYDALYDMMDMDKAAKLIERGTIEIAPLAFMRGRTLNDSFIILDEAQNTTSEQMKMYLTRLGFNSKTVITGDITQIDLPAGRSSGLVEATNVLRGIAGIHFTFFTEKDVVRHRIVQEIVKAYEQHEKRISQRQG